MEERIIRAMEEAFLMANASHSTSRRSFLKATSLASALFGASSVPLLSQATRAASGNRGHARKVIFLVSDGMNHGALSLAHHSLSFFRQQEANWNRLYRERPVVRALAETCSANSLITDSAAAASAWGGGRRVNNGAINVNGDGTPNEPLQTTLAKQGIPLGLVSTATITHATPAGFAANVSNRGSEEEIALQYLQRTVPVLLGGGRKFFPEEVLKQFSGNGYDLLHHRRDLETACGPRNAPVLGLFSSGHMPYALDRDHEPELEESLPTLAQMARFATERLDAIARDQWFLMVEGARIDHCGHANDAAGIIREQIAFDEAIGAMVDYVDRHPDTLLLISTDHGCGGVQLNGVNPQADQKMAPGIYTGTNHAFRRILPFRNSFEWMREQAGGLSGPPLREYLRSKTGIELTKDELKQAQGLKIEALAAVFARHHGISWTSAHHTADLVEFCAYGPGSHLFPTFLKNVEVHDLVKQAMAV